MRPASLKMSFSVKHIWRLLLGIDFFCNFHSFLTCAETYFALPEKLSSGGYDITVTRRNESIFKVIANSSSYGKKDLNSI